MLINATLAKIEIKYILAHMNLRRGSKCMKNQDDLLHMLGDPRVLHIPEAVTHLASQRRLIDVRTLPLLLGGAWFGNQAQLCADKNAQVVQNLGFHRENIDIKEMLVTSPIHI